MAQATYTQDPTEREIARKRDEIKAASQRTQARPVTTRGITVGVADASQFEQARAAQQAKVPRTGGITAGLTAPPSAAGLQVQSASYGDLSPSERAAFAKQNPAALAAERNAALGAAKATTNARMAPTPGAAPPSSPPAAPAAAPAGTPPPAARRRAPAATTLPKPAKPPTLGGKIAQGIGSVAAPIAGGATALETAQTGTQQYRDRGFGIAEGLLDGPINTARAGAKALGSLVGADPARIDARFDDGKQLADDLVTRGLGATADFGTNFVSAATLGLVDGKAAAETGRRALNGEGVLADLGGTAAEAAAPAGEAPAPDTSKVLGTFNGREITQAEADTLAAKLPTSNAPPASDGKGNFAYSPGAPGAAPNSGIATGLGGAPAANVGQRDSLRDAQRSRDARLTQLRDPTSEAGALYARLSADKTPTGKRVAAQFLSEFMGAGTAEFSDRLGAESRRQDTEAALLGQREGNATQLQAERSRGGQLTSDGEDGSLLSIADGIATPVTRPDGKAVKGGKGNAREQQLKDMETVSKLIDPQGLMEPAERLKQVNLFLQQLQQGQAPADGEE
jgi:hypothetical protein